MSDIQAGSLDIDLYFVGLIPGKIISHNEVHFDFILRVR